MRAYSCSKFFSGAFLGEWSLLLPEVLKVGIQQSHMGVIFRCPHTFGKQDLQLFIMLTSLIFLYSNFLASESAVMVLSFPPVKQQSSSCLVLHISCSATNNRCVISHWQSIELPVFFTVLQLAFVCQVTSVETFLAVSSALLVKINQTALKGGGIVLFFTVLHKLLLCY